MKIDTQTGLLQGAIYIQSPNCDERPGEDMLQLIVLHNISLPPGEFGGPWIEKLFTNELPADAHPYFQEIAGMKVSAHVLIRRSGEVVQFVPFHKRAWSGIYVSELGWANKLTVQLPLTIQRPLLAVFPVLLRHNADD